MIFSREIDCTKSCVGYISETVRCTMLILGREIGLGVKCSMSWCDLDLTCNLAVVTLTFKTMSGLYLRNCKV